MQNYTTSEIVFGLALILPLISFIVSFVIPDRYSWIVSITASAFILTSAILSLLLFFSGNYILTEANWFSIGSFTVHFSLTADAAARLMLVVVTVVSFLIHLYSIGYMAGDAGIRRYFGMLGFFTFSMLGIVVAGHLILLFMFWELVGFASYMLIGHWMEKSTAAKAAQKAFLFNRIGDAIFLIGILLMLVNEQHPHNPYWQTTGVLCIFAGVIGKSAQLPLFTWLTDAMEGPTPVSALLHAATMVAAGIFLLFRISPLLTETSLLVIICVGALTAVFGALGALNQFDIKKILAYSTISQLGLMVTAIGMGAKEAALLHLFTHAFFKAALFLAAGSVIHAITNSQLQSQIKIDAQDIRNLGGLRKKLPITFLTFCTAGASLAGLPLFSGYLSKDSILSAAWLLDEPLKWIVIIAISIVSFCTVLYTFRMIWFIFFGPESSVMISESPRVMRIPMIMLSCASIWLMVSLNPLNTNGWFAQSFPGIKVFTDASILSVTLIVVGFITARWMYRKSAPRSIKFIEQGFRLDSLYQKTFGVLTLKLSTITQTIDKKWIDGFIHAIVYMQVAFAHGAAWFDRYVIDGMVKAGVWLTQLSGSIMRSFQGGKIQLYIFWAVAGLIIFLFFASI